MADTSEPEPAKQSKPPKPAAAEKPSGHKAPKPAAEPVASAAAQETADESGNGGVSVSLGEVQRDWSKVLKHIQKILKQPNISALAQQGHPVALEGHVLTLGFTKKWEFHRERVDKGSEWVERGLWDILGAKLKVRTVSIEDEPDNHGGYGADTHADEPSEPTQHPLINDVLTIFDGTPVEIDNDPWEEK